MDNNNIKDDINEFNDTYFSESFNLIDNNLDFIDENNFFQPKRNYLFTFQFLTQVYQNFKNADYDFATSTLNKLFRDINNIYKIYSLEEKNLKIIEQIFEDKFLKKNKLFIEMNTKLKNLRSSIIINEKELQTIKILSEQIKELKIVYYEYFEDDFSEQNRSIQVDLKQILNSKIFYFDRLLWLDSKESFLLHKKFERLKISKNINSKTYLLEMLKVALPYTDNYKYLEKCLKVYR